MSALVVNFNADAANSLLNLDATNSALTSAISKLSSGLAVEFASQGAAAWSISQYLQYQNAGDTQAIANATQGNAVLNIASGAINQIVGILDQMEQLATSSANGGGMNSTSYAANTTQFEALAAEVRTIVANTNYGTQNLLDGSYSNETFQIGFQNTNIFTVSIPNPISPSGNGLGSLALASVASIAVSNTLQASITINVLQSALSTLSAEASAIGAAQVQLQAFVADLQTTSTNVMGANSSIVDVNMAQEMTTFTTDQILLQSGLSMLGQAQANPTLVLKLI